MVVIFKATCIGLFLLISHALSRKGAHDRNVGTVLFSRSDLNRSRWRLGEIKLLKARSFFQTVLPPALNITLLDVEAVNQFVTFFKTANNTLNTANVDFETNRIVTAAFSDAFGGYLKTWILPTVKHSYYSGTISKENVTNMYGIYDWLRKYLNTDGGGWHKPRTQAFKHIGSNATLHTSVPQTSPDNKVGKRKNPCGDLAFLEKTEDGFSVPIPRVNWQPDISTLWVPLKLPTLFSMDSTNGSAALIEYYGKAKDCLKMRSPAMLKNFQDRFQCWLDSDVLPHLTDERLYFALGSVLTLVKGAQSRNADTKVNIHGKYTSFMRTFHLPVELKSKKTVIFLLIFIELLWCISAVCCLWLSRRRKRNNSSNLFVGLNSGDRNSNSKGHSRFDSERRTSYVLGNLHSTSTSLESFDKTSDVEILFQRGSGDVNSKFAPRMFVEAKTKCSTPEHASKKYKRFMNQSSPHGANAEIIMDNLAAKSNITIEPQSYSLKSVSASDKDLFNHSKRSKHRIDNIEKHTINSKIKLQKSYTTKHHQITKANDDSIETIIKPKTNSKIFKRVSESSEKFSKQHSPSKYQTREHNINSISKYRSHNSDVQPALYQNFGNNSSLRYIEPPLNNSIPHKEPIYYSESRPDVPVILDSTNAVLTLPNTDSLSTVINEKEENRVPNSDCTHGVLAPVISNFVNPTLIDTPSLNTNDLTNPNIQKNKRHVRISETMTEVRSNTISNSLRTSVINGASYKIDTHVTDPRLLDDERMFINECSNTLYQKPLKSVSIMEPADIKSIDCHNTQHNINSDSSNTDIPKSISKHKRIRKRNLKRFTKPFIDKDETSSTNTDITKEYPATEVSDISILKSRKPRKRTVRQSVRPLKFNESGSNVTNVMRQMDNQRSFNTLQNKNNETLGENSRGARETVNISDMATKEDKAHIRPRSVDNIMSCQHEIEISFNSEDKQLLEDCAGSKACQNIFYLTEPNIVQSQLSLDTIEIANPMPIKSNLKSSIAPKEERICKKYTCSKELVLDKNNGENNNNRRMRWEITVNKPEKDILDIQGKIKIQQHISKIPKPTLLTCHGQKTPLKPSHLGKGQSLIPQLKKIVADDIALCTKDNAVLNKLNTTI